MSKQVITVKPDGSLFSLQHKKGQGVDLRQFGHAKVERVTLIEWSEHHQKWFIRWKSEDVLLDGLSWDFDTFQSAEVDYTAFAGEAIPEAEHDFFSVGDRIVYFADYEDAVRAEVAVIQNLQRSGQFVD
jgi:hypothetical protein